MKYYMAPMEGLTGYIYRNAYQKYCHDSDRCFTPFITNKKLDFKVKKDIDPEHNQGMEVVPQILTNQPDDFISIVKQLKQYGYDEVNLNLGCPSGTVVAKNRGAGFLAVPDQLDSFLDKIFNACDCKISIKTRVGKDSPDEWENLLAIYEKYPLSELIVHPRIQKDFYKYTPRMEAFRNAFANSAAPVCYNGDIVDRESYERLTAAYPALDAVMIGRGLLADPFLIETLSGQAGTERRRTQIERLSAFHQQILEGYCQTMSGDKNVLFKMKELWAHLIHFDPEWEPYIKKIRKAQRLGEYKIITGQMFRERKAAL